MADEKDYSLDGKDRAEWDQAWASMPHRRLLAPPKVEVVGSDGSDRGVLVSVTISEDPEDFSNNSWRPSETCPVCGATTVGAERLPASLHPTFSNGFSYGLGVWVHRSCFECCPDAEEPSPVPWGAAEQVAAADRAAMTTFRDIKPNEAARLLSLFVRQGERFLGLVPLRETTTGLVATARNAGVSVSDSVLSLVFVSGARGGIVVLRDWGP